MSYRAIAPLAAVGALLLAAPALAADPPLPPGGAAILSWTPEQQAYGYRNMEKIAPVHVVKRGDHVRALPAGKPIAPKWTYDGKAWTIDSYMAAMRTSGVLVLKDGKVVLER